MEKKMKTLRPGNFKDLVSIPAGFKSVFLATKACPTSLPNPLTANITWDNDTYHQEL